MSIDSKPDPKPHPLEALRAQRKFMMYQVIMIPVGIGAIVLTAFVAVNLFRGKMTLEAATNYIMGTLALATAGAVALGLKVIDANTREDEARIAAAAPKPAPSVVAVGEGARATSTVESATGPAAGSTDAVIASAKKDAGDTRIVLVPDTHSGEASSTDLSSASAVTPVDSPTRAALRK